VHSEKQCLKQKSKKFLKKVIFIVDFCQMIWYITNAQRKAVRSQKTKNTKNKNLLLTFVD